MYNTLIVLFLSFYSIVSFGQNEDLKKQINKIIRYDTEIDYKQTPGFVIGVIDGDSIFYQSFGQATKNADIQIDRDDIFEIGSTSKVMTSLLSMILIKEGLFTIDSKVNDLLPDNSKNPRLENLTIWDLINHNSGFSKIPEYFGKKQKNSLDPYAHFLKSDLLNYYSNYIPKKKNDSFSYSHTNYALLEVIMENKTGIAFHDLMDQKIFAPMNMHNSFVNFPENREITDGYNRAMRKVDPLHFPSFAGSEGVKSTMTDLCVFLKTILNSDDHIYKEIIGDQLTVQGETNYNDKIFIANGWHVVDQGKKYNIFTHTGKTSGHSSFVGFIKETKTAVVILSNSSIGTKDLGFLVLRMINNNWKRKV